MALESLSYTIIWCSLIVQIVLSQKNTCQWSPNRNDTRSSLICKNVVNSSMMFSFYDHCQLFNENLILDVQDSEMDPLDVIKLPPSFCNFNAINIVNSNIKTVKFDAFMVNQIVTELNLSFNNISNITFLNELSQNLEILNLSHNMLAEINFDKLEKRPYNLRILTLSHNKIRSIGNFSGNYNKLQELYLDDNQILELQLGIFSGSPNLKYINVAANKIIVFKARILIDVPSLKVLEVHNNPLTYFNDEHVDTIEHLKYLSMSYDNIYYTGITIGKCVNLKTLMFVDTHFTNFEPTYTCSLESIYLINATAENVNLKELENCNLRYVGSPLDRDSEYLDVLYLNFSGISLSTISPYSFEKVNYLNRLFELYLDFNNIRTIESETFSRIHNANVLSMKNSSIFELKHHSFNNILFTTKTDTNLVLEINLKNNIIEILKADTFCKIQGVATIDLSHNRIKKIEVGAFDDVEMTKFQNKFILTGNVIEKLERANFKGLKHLIVLKLDNNQVSTIECGAFEGLVDLWSLDLKHNRLKTLQCESCMSRNIKPDSLDTTLSSIESNQSCNRTSNITILAELSNNLETVDLSYNMLDEVNLNKFEKSLSKLHILSFTHNEIRSLASMRNNERYDHLSPTTVSSLQILNLNNNPLESINIEDNERFVNLNFLTLTYFNISFSRHSIGRLRNLTQLQLIDTHIHNIEPAAFISLNNLERLYLVNTTIETLDLQAFRDCNLKYVGGPLYSSNGDYKNVILFNLSDVSLQSISPAAFQMIKYSNQLFDLYLDDNNMNVVVSEAFSDIKNANVLSMRNSQIVKLQRRSFYNILFYPYSNESDALTAGIFLDHNKIETLGSDTFKNIRNVNSIDLGNNRIKEIESGTFNNVGMVTSNPTNILILSQNLIEKLERGSFAGLTDLINLKLDFNRINAIEDGAFESLIHLRSLDLKSNNLQKFECNKLCKLPGLTFIFTEHNNGCLPCKTQSNRNLADNQLEYGEADYYEYP